MTRISAKHKLSGASGFTLIELMVVVAIVALVSAAVVPSFSLALQRERQRTVANYVVQSVFAARSRAVRTGRCHRVTVTMGQPGISSGTGGLVVVEEYLRGDTCSTAAADGIVDHWNTVFSKPVASLVGGDVAIANARVDGANVGPGNDTIFHFESTGEILINDAVTRVFWVESYDAAGVRMGPRLFTRVSSGGSVGVRFIADQNT